MTPGRTYRAASTALTLALVLALGLLLPVSGAAAHGGLTGSSPSDGAVPERMPEQIELAFPPDVLGPGSTVRIQDHAGTDWASGTAEITDGTMVQPVKDGAPAGTYTVLWRALSTDSHPAEGSFSFTVRGTPETVTGSPAPASPSEPAAAEIPSAEATAETGQPAGPPSAAVLVIGAVLVLIIAGLVRHIIKRT